ncbi:MAG TPA: hypothetical protein GXX20_10025 [Clostridiaceae bacterium]|nr:hypothetical protein [Clostridiaceae bacterium]
MKIKNKTSRLFSISCSILTVILLNIAPYFNLHAYASQEFIYEAQARALYDLGLYDGVSADSYNPDLQATVDRETAIALLVKIFGDKEKALSMTDSEAESALAKYSDKGDISKWAVKFIAYAVKTGMVQGDTPTTISPKKPIDGRSYATMILRNLGYTVDGQGWSVALTTLHEKGGLTAEESTRFMKASLIKDDIVGISYGSLNAVSPSGKTLLSILIDKQVIDSDMARMLGLNTELSPAQENGTEEDSLYNTIKNALINVADKIDISKYISGLTSDGIFSLINKIVLETPEILYYDSCTYSSNGILEFRYSKDKETALSHLEILEQRVDDIIRETIKPDMTDYEKELAIHDYIINNARYDTAYFNKKNISPESYSAYGILVLGKGVCEGYSEAMKLIMDRLGIECIIVTGKSRNQNHAWNIINIEGNYYHLDLTWDDPVTNDGSDELTYDYFNVTDLELSKDHSWDKDQYPPCTSVKHNYYYYNGLVVDNYEDFYTRIKTALQEKKEEISLKIEKYDRNIYNINSAINSAFKETPDLNSISYEYSINDTTGVLTIRFKW